jgi:hypothetical membrane protein
MKASHSSETSAVYQTTQCFIQDGSNLFIMICGFKFCKLSVLQNPETISWSLTIIEFLQIFLIGVNFSQKAPHLLLIISQAYLEVKLEISYLEFIRNLYLY